MQLEVSNGLAGTGIVMGRAGPLFFGTGHSKAWAREQILNYFSYFDEKYTFIKKNMERNEYD